MLGVAMRFEKLGAVLASALAGIAACSDPTTHVLVGNAFNPTAMCLEPSSGFDVVTGPQPGQCAPTCVVDAKSGTTFVTIACPPYPPLDTTELADASTGPSDPCPRALAAWEAQEACSADGGPEAGATDDASDDAASGDAASDNGDAGRDSDAHVTLPDGATDTGAG